MIRGILVLAVLGAIVAWVIWERSDRALFKKVFWALYNDALKNAKDKEKLHLASINILEIMDIVEMGPRKIDQILSQMEKREYIKMKQNTVRLTPVGIAYFKFKYLNDAGANDVV